MGDLDNIDRAILRHLQTDGRMSNAALARALDLSPPATHARVRRLEENGLIEGYAARLNRARLGYDLLCIVQVSLLVHQFDQVQRFRETVLALPEVLECFHLTGEFDYLLKVVIRNREDLERFIVGELTPLPGVARIQTSVVLAEVKTTANIPIT